MALTVSFFDVMSGLIAALAVLSVICFAAMRGQRALAWLATALVIGAVEMQVMKLGGRSLAVNASVSVFVPFAHWCFTQAIRSTLSLGGSHRWLNAMIAGLTALSLMLLVTGADDFAQTLPFQIGAVLALIDGIACLLRERHRSLLNHALLIAQTMMVTMLILRIPVFPVILGGTSPFTQWTESIVLGKLLTGWAVVGPASVVLLIAKVVGGMMADYRDRAERDDLTSLLNRSAFHHAACGIEKGAVLLCDLDHFKAVNDRYGHAVGDDVIRAFARILRRQGGHSARIGGEEFALLLPDASLEVAAAKAEAIREYFRAFRHAAIDPDDPLSASFGVTAFAAGESVRAALIRADAALYSAKRAGRNRVNVAGSATTEPSGALHRAA